MNVRVIALYKFVDLPDFESLRPQILRLCKDEQIFGTILLAAEGINGTIAGPEAGLRRLLAFLIRDPRLADLEHKDSWCEENPFYRMKVRLKREIVTMGVAELDAARQAGDYVEPEDWNALISDPETVVIDTRNDYEVAIGTFAGAIDPQTTNFRDLPRWLAENRDRLAEKRKVAMFCTGGIRCEKATAYLKREGFTDVFHLKGGILKYLETVPEQESLWQGECFVFDNRVSVGHGLRPGPYDLCHACRRPICDEDKTSPAYRTGVSCPYCYEKVSDEQKVRFAERQKQVEIAKARGERHIAADFEAARERKQREHLKGRGSAAPDISRRFRQG
jgi:UPF0176 protein